MKPWLFILMFVGAIARAEGNFSSSFSGAAPLTTTWDTTVTYQMTECKGNVVEMFNQSSALIAYGFGTATTVPPFVFSYIPPGPASGTRVKPKGGLYGKGTYLYIKAVTGSVTSGSLAGACFYEEKP